MIRNWAMRILIGVYKGVIVAQSILAGSVVVFALLNQKAVDNSHLVNSICLFVALLSLTALVTQTIGMKNILEKREYRSTQDCPHCRHRVDIRLRETD